MRRAIGKHVKEAVALVLLATIAAVVGIYILQEQRMRLPLIEPRPFTLKLELETAQAVTPGQGQTVRVAGVRIGDIGDIDLKNGRAYVTMVLEEEFDDLVHADATAFLRPKTGLKDMFVELNPGTPKAPLLKRDGVVPVRNTLPDVNPDEFFAALDADTRDYLKLLLNGARRGLEGRADDLSDVLKRFEPTYRDLALVTGEVSKRSRELRRLITSLAVLNGELAKSDDDLAELVDTSARTFRNFAAEKSNVTATVRELPGALVQLKETLTEVRGLGEVLGPASDALRPAVRALHDSNPAVQKLAEDAEPPLRRFVRPLVRDLRPLARELEPAAHDLVIAEPEIKRVVKVFNNFFNMLAFNSKGREGPDVAGRDEGYLFYLGWLAHQSVNLFSTADAHGPLRALTLGGTCGTLKAIAAQNPGAEFIFGLAGPLLDPAVCGGVN